MELHFSDFVGERLRRMSWDTSRKIDIAQIVDYFEARGLHLNELARAVWESFGGMKFSIPEGGLPSLVFDPKACIEFLLADKLRLLERSLGEPLSPIAAGGGFQLFVTPSLNIA